MGFLPKGYKVPSNGDARSWWKPETGVTTVRILSNCITGTEYWDDNSPVRVMDSNDVPNHIDDAKHFWMVPVAVNGEINIWTITQKSIQSQIFELMQSKKWGDPQDYDLDVKREGAGLQTRYTITPNPKEDLDTGVANRYKIWATSNNLVDIAFSKNGKQTEEKEKQTEEKEELPF